MQGRWRRSYLDTFENMSLKILQIAPRLPYPPDDGGAIGIYNITKQLARRGHTVRFLTIGRERELPSPMKEFCSANIAAASTRHSLFKAGLSICSSMPYTVYKYRSAVFRNMLDAELRASSYDILHADHLVMAPYALYAKREYGIPVVLREHNLESTFLERYAQNEARVVLRWFAQHELKKMRAFEPEVCRQFDRCIMITNQDDAALRALSPAVRTTVVPAGVEILPELEDDSGGENILFLASLNWPPNIQGFEWFYEHVLPLVLQSHPSATVTIIGKGGSAKLGTLGHPNIRYVGYVDKIEPYVREATVAIVPLLAGGGMRIKILELFAHGKAVVSTSVGCEGIEVFAGRDLFIADTPAEFARSISAVIQNRDLRRALGQAGKKLVEKKYSWESVGERLETVYREVLSETSGRR